MIFSHTLEHTFRRHTGLQFPTEFRFPLLGSGTKVPTFHFSGNSDESIDWFMICGTSAGTETIVSFITCVLMFSTPDDLVVTKDLVIFRVSSTVQC